MKHFQDIIVPILQEHETQLSEPNNPRQQEVTSYDQLPVALKADQVAAVLTLAKSTQSRRRATG